MRGSHRLLTEAFAGALAALLATGAFAQPGSSVDPRRDVTVNYSALASVPVGSDISPRQPAASHHSNANILSGLSLSNLTTKPADEADAGKAAASADKDASRPGNILFDVTPKSAFTPYIGLGFGGVAGRVSDMGRPGAFLDNGAEGGRAYQGLAGFAYTIDKGTKLDFGYRFANTQRPNMPLADNLDLPGSERDRAAVLSLRYDLNPPK